MGFIPHPPIYLSLIRMTDIWFLLAVGALYELVCRLYLLSIQMKPARLVRKEEELKVLQAETNMKRKLGPSAFVETSKLERQVLALEKELEAIYTQRQKAREDTEKILLRGGNMKLSALIWILYYSVPILTVDDMELAVGEYTPAGSFLKTMFFPLSYIGIGNRIAKWGLPADVAANSVGALMVMWSSQVTVGKLMDAVDSYYLS